MAFVFLLSSCFVFVFFVLTVLSLVFVGFSFFANVMFVFMHNIHLLSLNCTK